MHVTAGHAKNLSKNKIVGWTPSSVRNRRTDEGVHPTNHDVVLGQVLRPTISICFVNASMYSETTACHSVFRLLDPRHGHRMTNRIEMHVVELPKFTNALEGLAEGIDRWLYFLRHAESIDPQAV